MANLIQQHIKKLIQTPGRKHLIVKLGRLGILTKNLTMIFSLQEVFSLRKNKICLIEQGIMDAGLQK